MTLEQSVAVLQACDDIRRWLKHEAIADIALCNYLNPTKDNRVVRLGGCSAAEIDDQVGSFFAPYEDNSFLQMRVFARREIEIEHGFVVRRPTYWLGGNTYSDGRIQVRFSFLPLHRREPFPDLPEALRC